MSPIVPNAEAVHGNRAPSGAAVVGAASFLCLALFTVRADLAAFAAMVPSSRVLAVFDAGAHEPVSLVLLGVGLLTVGAHIRRRVSGR